MEGCWAGCAPPALAIFKYILSAASALRAFSMRVSCDSVIFTPVAHANATAFTLDPIEISESEIS